MPQLLIDLTDEDGADLGRMPLADFLRDNDIHEREDVEAIEEVLYGCGSYTGGGGAAPEWTLRRVPEAADAALIARGRELLASAVPAERLPSRRIPTVAGNYETSRWLQVRRDGAGFVLEIERHFIDRRGEKDSLAETLSRHPTLADATAAFDAHPAQALAEAA